MCRRASCSAETIACSRLIRGVAEERLGITPDEIDGGHTPALSRPKELAERLEAFRVSIVRDDPDAQSNNIHGGTAQPRVSLRATPQ